MRSPESWTPVSNSSPKTPARRIWTALYRQRAGNVNTEGPDTIPTFNLNKLLTINNKDPSAHKEERREQILVAEGDTLILRGTEYTISKDR
jgi:hypothetical protein